jgi:hypothetical protein
MSGSRIVLLVLVVAASELVTLLCLRTLWRSNSRLLGRILWSLVLVVPVLGPATFAVLYGDLPGPDDDFPSTPRSADFPFDGF